ncbi:MAG: type V CRISPR-associated protein Cas12b [Akkermansia sp.]|nr:type V CRISPR-associated protein Cas12b [Akkermansia sp.]
MITRIYQAKVVSKSIRFENPEIKGNPMEAMWRTHNLFQDAVNYHIVALAGMAEDEEQTIGGQFREQVKKMWKEHPRDITNAETLSESLARTLTRKAVSFEEAVESIFEGCERPDILPYVLAFVLSKLEKGEGVIQQEGRELLPKLCNPDFDGNYDYSAASKGAGAGMQQLVQAFATGDANRYPALAAAMDLSWAGVKTAPGKFWTEEETYREVADEMAAFRDFLKAGGDAATNKLEAAENINLYEAVSEVLETRTPAPGKLLARNNKAVLSVKRSAIFFMYYPCELSAKLLSIRLKKASATDAAPTEARYDFTNLEDDPVSLSRGARGYVYRGFSALPNWESSDNLMYEKEWDILAFKEALKALHSFSLKTEERRQERERLEGICRYMKTGEGKPSVEGADDEDDEGGSYPVLGGDVRYELLEKLAEELRQDEDDSVYSVSRRALKCAQEVIDAWKKCCSNDAKVLRAEVRRVQAEKGPAFGSQPLYELLCEERYQPIWRNAEPADGKPRSKNILRDFCLLQELQDDIEKLSRPVRLTAAEPNYSPRPLTYSDMKSFGDCKKGCEFVPQEDGTMRLAVVVGNGRGHWQAEMVRVSYNAPRMVRDELGTDSAKWPKDSKDKKTDMFLLQPMMKGLGMGKLPRMEKQPAVTLDVHGHGEETRCYLNFPVTLDMEPLRAAIGKAGRWAGQLLGKSPDLLHLHWPGTYKGKQQPWWTNPDIQKDGFTVLGVDLGVRYAAAWSLVECNLNEEEISKHNNTVKGRKVGTAGELDWYGYIRRQGLLCLPGEGGNETIPRRADETELAEAADILKAISDNGQDGYLKEDRNILEVNGRLLYAFRRLLSRYRRYLNFCYNLGQEDKREKTMGAMLEYFKFNEVTQSFIPGMMDALLAGDTGKSLELIMEATLRLRGQLPGLAERIAELLLPRKSGTWRWVPVAEADAIGTGVMQVVDPGITRRRKIYRSGGLSVARLTQLEDWRKRLQSMSHLLATEPGDKPVTGRARTGAKVIDPCPDLRVKIDNVREQRVNQIAHLIAAQALGLRLKPSREGKNAAGQDIIHGEYEPIPGRKPVDFVVMENLSRYLTSIDKSKTENSTLMKWAHRQIVAKVQQVLEEVFGIPVVFTHAAYTSKFDSLTSAPGFRAMPFREVTERDKSKMPIRVCCVYESIFKAMGAEKLPVGFDLYAPHPANGGEFFVSLRDGEPVVRNADINASANIAWRGIAAPESIHLLHRVRMERTKRGEVRPRRDNLREKAMKNAAFCVEKVPELKETYFGAFYDNGELHVGEKLGTLDGNPLSAGVVMWGYLKQGRWNICHRLNIRLLRKIGMDNHADLLQDAVESSKEDK